MSRPLTQRQQMVLDFIRQSIRDRGYPPTIREIAIRMGIGSTNGVSDHLRALERKGYLTRDNLKSRGLRPAAEAPSPADTTTSTLGPDFVVVPVFATLAAGIGPVTGQQVDELRLERRMLGPKAVGVPLFGYRMTGDALLEQGIFEGDYLIARRQHSAEHGSLVIVCVNESPSVAYYYLGRDVIRLQPRNKSMAPIYVNAFDFKPTMMVGVVIGLYRRVLPPS